MNVCVMDTETTSLNYEDGRIIDVCVRSLYDRDDVFYRRCNPGVPIPKEASDVHGITDDMIAGCPTFEEIAWELKAFIEKFDEAIVGYNLRYDVAMVEASMRRAGLSVTWPPWHACALRVWSILEPRNLQEAYKHFVDDFGFTGAHGARADVDATASVFLKQMTRLLSARKLAAPPWAEIDDKRAEREKRQQEMAAWVGPSHHFIWNDAHTDVFVNFGKMQGKSVREMDAGYCRYIIDKDFPPHAKEIAKKCVELMRDRKTAPADKMSQFLEFAGTLR